MERFGLAPDMSVEAVQERLRQLEETIRRRIMTETKIKVIQPSVSLIFFAPPRDSRGPTFEFPEMISGKTWQK